MFVARWVIIDNANNDQRPNICGFQRGNFLGRDACKIGYWTACLIGKDRDAGVGLLVVADFILTRKHLPEISGPSWEYFHSVIDINSGKMARVCVLKRQSDEQTVFVVNDRINAITYADRIRETYLFGENPRPLFKFAVDHLPIQNAGLHTTDDSKNGGQDGDRHRRMGKAPAKFVLGCFLLLCGVASAYGAYAALDQPSPSRGWLFCGIVGWGVMFLFVGYGTLLILQSC